MNHHGKRRAGYNFLFALLITAAGLLSSCSKKPQQVDSSNLIPEKELVSILTDLYITDGLLSHTMVIRWFNNLDTSTTYRQVIEQHGYTKEDMDKTMKYYYIKKPKKLIAVYDQILVKLSEMDSRYEKAALAELSREENKWTGEQYFALPASDGQSSLTDVPLDRQGTYTLTFTAILFPDDMAGSTFLMAYTSDPGMPSAAEPAFFKVPRYIRDGRPHTYTIEIKSVQNTALHLYIDPLFCHYNTPSSLRHALVYDIKLTYSYTMT